jgi:hypothetical protein
VECKIIGNKRSKIRIRNVPISQCIVCSDPPDNTFRSTRGVVDASGKNYQFGLDWLRESLSKEQQEQLQPKIEQAEAQLKGFPDEYRAMQAKIIVLQMEHNREKEIIAAHKVTAQRIFWSLYHRGTPDYRKSSLEAG